MQTLRVFLGSVLGYILSIALSLGWFAVTHHSTIGPASATYIALTVVWSVMEGLLAGAIAAFIGRSRISSFGVALLIVLISIWAWTESKQRLPVWSLSVAMLILAPSACFGFLLPWVRRFAR